MIIRPLFVFARFPPRISIILFEWINYPPRQRKSVKTKIRQK
nr:MAG TPA: hypothetical protein [Caudoviricetes sp.]